MDDFVRVASVGDVPAGGCVLVEVGDERILLSQLDGEFFAIDEVCTHAEGPLSEGPWRVTRSSARTTAASST